MNEEDTKKQGKKESTVFMDDFNIKQMTDLNNDNNQTKRLMEDYDIDEEIAETAQELMDEGIDEAEAVEIAEEL